MSRPLPARQRWHRAGLILVGLSLLGSVANARAESPAMETPAAATQAFYDALNNKDMAGLSAHLSEAGFTEISPGQNEAHRLDLATVRRVVASPTRFALHAEMLEVQQLGDLAIVTGRRVGSIQPETRPAQDAAALFSMVWQQQEGHWLLRHAHLSALPASLATTAEKH